MSDWGQVVHDYGPTFIAATFGALNVIVLLWGLAKASGKHSGDLSSLANWAKAHQSQDDKQDAAISRLERIAASLEATEKGQERRLVLLEERKH
jgi:hypothetical protein